MLKLVGLMNLIFSLFTRINNQGRESDAGDFMVGNSNNDDDNEDNNPRYHNNISDKTKMLACVRAFQTTLLFSLGMMPLNLRRRRRIRL